VERRRRSAALLVRADLQLAAGAIQTTLDEGYILLMEAASLPSWEAHAWELTTLQPDEFEVVVEACMKISRSVERARHLGRLARWRRAPKLDDFPEARDAMKLALDIADKAVNVLGPVAYPGQQLTPWPPADRFAA